MDTYIYHYSCNYHGLAHSIIYTDGVVRLNYKVTNKWDYEQLKKDIVSPSDIYKGQGVKITSLSLIGEQRA